MKNTTVLPLHKIASALAKICRYAGKGKFCSVLIHSFVVADMVPPPVKFYALTHDQVEVHTSDVCSPYKDLKFRRMENRMLLEMYRHQGVRPPTRKEWLQVFHADHRAAQGEVWTVGDTSLRADYAVRDREAERLTLKYFRKYPALRANSVAVKEFMHRFQEYKKLIKAL